MLVKLMKNVNPSLGFGNVTHEKSGVVGDRIIDFTLRLNYFQGAHLRHSDNNKLEKG